VEEESALGQWAAAIRRAFEALETSSYYQVLGVAHDEPQELIRKAFHRRAEQLHPDRHRGTPEPTRSEVYAIFKRMTEAYRVLIDPDLRRAYDLGLKDGRLRLTDETAAQRPPSNEDLLKSPGGQRHYRAAMQALAANDLPSAELNLKLAMSHEGDLAFLKELAEEVKQKRLLRQTIPSVPAAAKPPEEPPKGEGG
jgi:curved DNA-binding protein CbpA